MKYIKLYEDIDFDDWEEDFEEEDDDEISPGDTVLVLPNLEKYIKKERWPDKMYDLIGNTYKVLREEYIRTAVDHTSIRYVEYHKIYLMDTDYYVPIQTVKKV